MAYVTPRVCYKLSSCLDHHCNTLPSSCGNPWCFEPRSMLQFQMRTCTILWQSLTSTQVNNGQLDSKRHRPIPSINSQAIIYWKLAFGPNTKTRINSPKSEKVTNCPPKSPDRPQNVWTVAVSGEWLVLHSPLDPTYHMHEMGRRYSAEPAQAQLILSFLTLPLSLKARIRKN